MEYKERQKLLVMFKDLTHLQEFAATCGRPRTSIQNEEREANVHNF